ncbi:hypothetical protein SH2C18_26340 [Clostridium sediminicola]|uniref:sigma-54 interaction domain-containing protein n=1 Tax=Clostridium sediminicola TaxID=3114879 RepID=UPI0031F241F8
MKGNKDFLQEYCISTKSKKFQRMLYLCEKVAKTNVNVLLIGESGSGKEVAAKYIHYCSKRNHNPLIIMNCSSYTDNLLESELFGHEEGAFTGAIKAKRGKIEMADKSTLFLDEIGDLNLVTQIKLLRTLETKKIQRVGSNKETEINFRLITATNIDMKKAVLDEKVREDFFYRISTVVIKVPSLRDRREDLEDLIDFMLEKSQEENEIQIHDIEPQVKEFLLQYEYPGNLRELKNILDRMVVLSENGVITENGLPIMHSIKPDKENVQQNEFKKVIPLRKYKQETEKNYLAWVLKRYNGNVSKASKDLNISSRQLFNKINEYDLRQK